MFVRVTLSEVQSSPTRGPKETNKNILFIYSLYGDIIFGRVTLGEVQSSPTRGPKETQNIITFVGCICIQCHVYDFHFSISICLIGEYASSKAALLAKKRKKSSIN